MISSYVSSAMRLSAFAHPKASTHFCIMFALVCCTNYPIHAQVNVQLNLRYFNPGCEDMGGTWELLAGSEGGGIAELTVLIDGINNDASPAGATGFENFASQQVGSLLEFVLGSEFSPPPASDIGLGAGTTGNVVDDLFGPGSSPLIWEQNALLAAGTFGENRPVFLLNSGTLSAGVHVLDGSTITPGTFGTMSVRGDGVASDGLLIGDLNRGGDVDLFGDVLGALGNVGTGTTWDAGDFDCSGGVDIFDDVLRAFSSFGDIGKVTPPPPSIGVPEPSTLAMFILSMLFCFTVGATRNLQVRSTIEIVDQSP